MKRLICLAVAILLLSSVNVFAGIASTVRAQEGPWFAGYSNPGEFKITVEDYLPIGNYNVGDSFQTFCIESDEYLWTPGAGASYEWVLNDRAIAGGGGAVGGEDVLDERTAYLFTKFTLGTLGNYDFSNSLGQRVSDGVALQDAIAYIEQESTAALTGKALAWLTEAENAIANSLWSGIGNVRILNLYDYDNSDNVAEYFGYTDDNYTINRQDVLVLIPEPATMAILAIGGLLVTRKRK